METFKQFTPRQIETFNPVDTVMGQIANSATELFLPKNLRVKEVFATSDSDVHMRRGLMVARKAMTGTYTVSVSDFLIGITSLAVSADVGLPRPRDVGIGKLYIVKDEVGGAASTTITVRSVGEENLDGASTSTLTTNYQAKSFYTDGANWFTY